MPDKNEPEKLWDEYDWERFLQQQDRKTERYMDLLEKYIDDPDRDQIIAREMGWPNPLESNDFNWNDLPFQPDEEEEDAFEASSDDSDEEEDEEDGAPESFELHPLYQASFGLTVWIDQIFDELGDEGNHPAAVKLATNSAVASAKLAAALSDDDVEELGMTIAYLKRALKAITNAIDASLVFGEEAGLSSRRRRQLHARLFQVRDGIIELMGDYRSEWRRRYGV